MNEFLDKQSILKSFQMSGTESERECLLQLLNEVLATKSGKQLIMDVLASDFLSKPISLKFGTEKELGGWGGKADAEKGIILSKIPQEDIMNKTPSYLLNVCSFAHELHHLKNSKIFYPLSRNTPLIQKVYAGLTDEACTYAFELCAFRKELQQKYSENKISFLKIPLDQSEFIEGWMQGRFRNAGMPLVAKYIDYYLKCDGDLIYCPEIDEKKFMDKMAEFQQRKTAIPLENFPWYKPSKLGGYYIVGYKNILQVDKNGCPVYYCAYTGKDREVKFYSRAIGGYELGEDGKMVPTRFVHGEEKRPMLLSEYAQIQDFWAGKIRKEDLNFDKELKLPKGVENMFDLIEWRESFVPDRPLLVTSHKKGSKDTKPHECSKA